MSRKREDPLPTQLATARATYRRLLSDFLREHEGEFVLIKGEDVIGFWKDEDAAIAEADRRFPLQPFLVKKIEQHENPVIVPYLPCQSFPFYQRLRLAQKGPVL
jgi:hypothetical protein